LSAAFLAIGSLLAAIAQNYATIIAGRSIQGIGAGGISAVTDIIITDTVPLRFRGQWFAFISVPWAIGTTVGPILSGILTKYSWWVWQLSPFPHGILKRLTGSQRWIFAINVLISASAILACLWTLPPLPRGRDCLSRLRDADFIGFTILSVSLVSTLVPIMQVASSYETPCLQTQH
jgi:MFS family permease